MLTEKHGIYHGSTVFSDSLFFGLFYETFAEFFREEQHKPGKIETRGEYGIYEDYTDNCRQN